MTTGPNAIKPYFPILLILPISMGVLALKNHGLLFKLGEPLSCVLLLLVYGLLFGLRPVGFMVAALLCSSVGDYFMANRGGNSSYFIYGIGAFFVAHLGYLAFALKNGRMHWASLVVLLVIFLPFFGLFIRPAIKDTVLLLAVLLYLLVSCVSLAAAMGLKLPLAAKSFYGVGIGLIVLSDLIIALSEFVHYRDANWLILPTYYMAHWCVTLAVLWREGISAGSGRKAA